MKGNKSKFVGFYHYGVILTYLSVAAAITGCILSVTVGAVWGVVCLLISGLCDAFDGAVANTRKNRTEEDKKFGEQIDSLSDMISFGFAPVMIGVGLGMTQWYFIIMYCVYVLCALIRLAYFNVTEEVRIKEGAGKRTSYEGLPVTNVAVGLPVFYLVATAFSGELLFVQFGVMALCYLLVAFLFVFRFTMPKFGVKKLLITIFILSAIILIIVALRYTVFNAPVF